MEGGSSAKKLCQMPIMPKPFLAKLAELAEGLANMAVDKSGGKAVAERRIRNEGQRPWRGMEEQRSRSDVCQREGRS